MKQTVLGTIARSYLIALAVSFASAARAEEPSIEGCLAANESALKLREDHKLRGARAELLVCAASSCPSAVRNECARLVSEINPDIPTIIFEAKDSAGADKIAVTATMDGVRFADKLDGTAVELDPGEHTFTFETEGQPPLRKQFVIRQGEKDRRERVVFETATGVPAVAPKSPATAAPGSPSSASLAVASPSAPHAPPTKADSANGAGAQHGSFGAQKIGAIAAAAVGAVGVGFGIGFGVSSMKDHNDASSACSNPSSTPCSSPTAIGTWRNAVTAGTISTAAFVVGGVALAGAGVLWFTAKGGTDAVAAPQVGLGLGSIQLAGVF